MMIPDTSIQQVAYVAGRVRSQDRALIGWLVELLIRHPDYQVKAKALQALAMQGQALETFAWLEALLKSMAAHPHATPGTLRQCIQDIAAWRNARLQTWGFKDTLTEQPDAVLYLRGKAVEALEWIGTQQTLDDLSPEVPDWPLELRGVWHFTAMAIQRRLQPVG
jgi:HEAT repeat protein